MRVNITAIKDKGMNLSPNIYTLHESAQVTERINPMLMLSEIASLQNEIVSRIHKLNQQLAL